MNTKILIGLAIAIGVGGAIWYLRRPAKPPGRLRGGPAVGSSESDFTWCGNFICKAGEDPADPSTWSAGTLQGQRIVDSGMVPEHGFSLTELAEIDRARADGVLPPVVYEGTMPWILGLPPSGIDWRPPWANGATVAWDGSTDVPTGPATTVQETETPAIEISVSGTFGSVSNAWGRTRSRIVN